MAITHNRIEGLTKQMYEMSAKESELNDQLATVVDARKALANQLREALECERRYIEQTLLQLDFEAGDETVERDQSAGNGSGVYRRKSAGPDYSSLSNMGASTKSGQDIVR